MKFAIQIGSYARLDFNEKSDCDVLLIEISEHEFDLGKLPQVDLSIVNFVHYDQETFLRLHDIGSLFLFHTFFEGKLLAGNAEEWSSLKNKFSVQRNFQKELYEISKATQLLSETEIFGGKYLTPLVNAFTELKNACIFFLAHRKIYEFNKSRCFDLALKILEREAKIKELKAFYDYSVRTMTVNFPFNYSDDEISSSKLIEAHKIVLEMCNACE